MTMLRTGPRTIVPAGICLVAALVLSGCMRSRPARFYTLHPVLTHLPAATAAESVVADDMLLGVGPVRVPGYMERGQIVTRLDRNEVKLSEFNRWADTVSERIPGITQALDDDEQFELGGLSGRLKTIEALRRENRHLDRCRGVVTRIGIRPVQGIQGEVFRSEVFLPELEAENPHRIRGLHPLQTEGQRGQKGRAGLQRKLGLRFRSGLMGLKGGVRLQGPGHRPLQRKPEAVGLGRLARYH